MGKRPNYISTKIKTSQLILVYFPVALIPCPNRKKIQRRVDHLGSQYKDSVYHVGEIQEFEEAVYTVSKVREKRETNVVYLDFCLYLK